MEHLTTQQVAELRRTLSETVPPPVMPEYLTTAEVAEMYRTSPETVRYWRHIKKPGYPKSFRAGRKVLYRANEVREHLKRLYAEQNDGAAA